VTKQPFQIPNLCRNSSVLVGVSAAGAIALILTLVRDDEFSLDYFSLSSFYIAWLVLGSMALLCLLRITINRASPTIIWLCPTLVMLAVAAVIEAFSVGLLSVVEIEGSASRMLACLVSGVIITALFGLLYKLESGARAESQSRLQSLQSRMNPHFLFNSLNTVAELIVSDPQAAEKSLQSLSLITRANLDDANDQHTLDRELALCESYLQLERWRLGARLEYQSNIDVKGLKKYYVPKLSLQPLIENAIVHGIHHLPDGGRVELDIRESNKHLSMKVSNTFTEIACESMGNGIALDNTRERLRVMYDDDFHFKSRVQDNVYMVVMRIPKVLRRVVL